MMLRIQMEQNLTTYIFLIPGVLSMLISFFVALYALRHRHVRASLAFAVLAFSQSVYAMGYMFELYSPDLQSKIFWDYFQWYPTVVWPLALLFFSIRYVGLHLKKPALLVAVIIAGTLPSVLYLVLNPLHGEIYRDASLSPGDPFDELRYTFSPAVKAGTAWFSLICIAALVVLGLRMPKREASGGDQHRIVFAGQLVAAIGLLWGIVDIRIGPLFRDITPFTFAWSNLIIGWGLFRYHLLDVVPVARDRILGVINDIAIVTDPQHRILDINQAALRLLPPGSITPFGRALEDVFSAWPPLVEAIRLCESAKNFGPVFEADGESYRLVREPLEKNAFVYFGRNVTADLKIERMLRDANEDLENRIRERTRDLSLANASIGEISDRLKEIINALPFILVGVDDQLRVTHWNDAAVAETGLSLDRVLGQPLNEFWQTFSEDMERLSVCMHTGIPLSFKDTYSLHSPGRLFAVTTLAVSGGAVLIREDITTECRVQDTLVQTEKMVSLGGLAAGMAHELNNPLAGILQSLQVMEQRLRMKTNKGRKAAEERQLDMDSFQFILDRLEIFRLLSSTVDAGTRMKQIVANMLSFSQRRIEFNDNVDLAVLLDESVQIARTDYDIGTRFDFRKIDIRREYDSDCPPISCSRSKLQQVIFNLLKNGAEAMVATAAARPPLFTLCLKREGDFAVIEVEDNGPGMDAQTQSRVFEPFFTTKPTGVGTGLGMSVAYYIVTESHRGVMTVRTAPDQGCMFQIRLPIWTAETVEGTGK